MNAQDIVEFERAQALLTEALEVRARRLQAEKSIGAADGLEAVNLRMEVANLSDLRHFMGLGDSATVKWVISTIG